MKKRLSEQQEFEIMKLVLDKFLLLGMGIMAYGVYVMIASAALMEGAFYLLIGAVVLIAFLVLIIKEFEILK